MPVRQATDLYGQRFGFLKVLGRGSGPGKAAYWECECTLEGCGQRKSIRTDNLRSGRQVSCGCVQVRYPFKSLEEVKRIQELAPVKSDIADRADALFARFGGEDEFYRLLDADVIDGDGNYL